MTPTPIPVTFHSPLPVILHAPVAVQVLHALHVHVDNPPDSVSVWTLRIAIATLLAVGFQIWLSWRELRYVKQDLENNQKQMAEFMRRPSLQFRGSRTVRYLTVWNQVGVRNADTIVFTLYVSNVGERGADHHLLEILTPLETSYLHSKAADNDPLVRIVDGKHYFVDSLVGDWLFPNGVPAIYSLPVVVQQDIPSIRFLWRMYDEFAKYPLENYGSFDVIVKVHMADLQPLSTDPKDEEQPAAAQT